MKFSTIISLLFLSNSLTLAPGVQSGELDESSNLVKFQHRLAEKGNNVAQYKLASMYEIGIGTGQDIEQAKYWYGLAASDGMAAAAQRLSYLEIKQRGFNQSKDTDWLNNVKAGSEKQHPDAMYLLAQMYRGGVGVNKDLNQAVKLLNKISVFDVPYVDREIERTQAELRAIENTAKNQKIQKAKRKKLVSRKVESTQPVVQNNNEQYELKQKIKEQAESLKIQEAQMKAEKRLRYEKVMADLKREQEIIDEQQSKVSGGKAIGVDEEF